MAKKKLHYLSLNYRSYIICEMNHYSNKNSFFTTVHLDKTEFPFFLTITFCNLFYFAAGGSKYLTGTCIESKLWYFLIALWPKRESSVTQTQLYMLTLSSLDVENDELQMIKKIIAMASQWDRYMRIVICHKIKEHCTSREHVKLKCHPIGFMLKDGLTLVQSRLIDM